ncbi:MAG: hypothetical protein O7B77_06175, partial [Actinobacteria bacterium]|nr:hypothetical protein [Actinomycetota bacterium]
FGYALTQDTRQQKLFLIVGPKRSGKGTIARVLTAMVGADNVCNPTLASLSTPAWPVRRAASHLPTVSIVRDENL